MKKKKVRKPIYFVLNVIGQSNMAKVGIVIGQDLSVCCVGRNPVRFFQAE